MLDAARIPSNPRCFKIVTRLLDKAQSKLELYRLERKFTRRKHRATWNGEVEYVDGEYFFTGVTHKI